VENLGVRLQKKIVGLDNYGRKTALIVGMEKINT